MSDQERTPATTAATGTSARDKARLGLWGMLVVLVTVFAVLNTTSVEVNWIFGTFRTPLIVVILVCLAIGLVVGLVGGRRMASGRRAGKP